VVGTRNSRPVKIRSLLYCTVRKLTSSGRAYYCSLLTGRRLHRHSACVCVCFWTESPAFGTATSWTDDVVRLLPHLLLIICLAGLSAITCSAAVITAIGENATNAAQWRTQTTKAINPAGNNIYGNDGYVMFTTSAVGSGSGSISGDSSINPFTFSGTISGVSGTATTLNVMPTYVSAFTPLAPSSSQVFDGVAVPPGLPFDNPNVPGGQLASGVAFAGEGNIFDTGTTNQPLFSFTVNSHVPASFTVGLFFTNSGGIASSAGIEGGGVTTPVTISRSSTSILDALFFRITGAVSGDTYTIVASGPGGGLLGDNNIDIMGITFDSTPEPTTLAGSVGVSLALIWLSRRRKKVLVTAFG
jgi:hypothetical protein